MRRAATLAAALSIGCAAPPPAEIPPRYVSPLEFREWTCAEVRQELPRLAGAITEAGDRNDRREVARLAGTYRALLTVDALRQCYRREGGGL